MSEKNVDQIIASALKRRASEGGDDLLARVVESLASFEVEIEENVKLSVTLTFPPAFLDFVNRRSASDDSTGNGVVRICRNCANSASSFDGSVLHLPTTASNTHTLTLSKRAHLETLIELLAREKSAWLAAGAPGAVAAAGAKVLTI